MYCVFRQKTTTRPHMVKNLNNQNKLNVNDVGQNYHSVNECKSLNKIKIFNNEKRIKFVASSFRSSYKFYTEDD